MNFFKHCKRLKHDFKPQTLFLKNDQNDLLSEPREIVQENILIRYLIRIKQIRVIGPGMKNWLIKRPNQNARSLISQR
jgi:hypothetical protein